MIFRLIGVVPSLAVTLSVDEVQVRSSKGPDVWFSTHIEEEEFDVVPEHFLKFGNNIRNSS